jgi:alpha-tubulin suppressor-like RCC1 family protein
MSESEMVKVRSTGYRGLMRSLAKPLSITRPFPAPALLLVCCVWSCGDGEDLTLDVNSIVDARGGGAGDSTAGGSLGLGGAAGHGGELLGDAGASAPDAGAGTGGQPEETPTSGGTEQGGRHETAGDTGNGGTTTHKPIPPGINCQIHEDCDDGSYCNGIERCLPRFDSPTIRVCKAPTQPPCGTRECDEVEDECDCSDPDQDGDFHLLEGCTDALDFDCDDDDGNRNPARPEVCDPRQYDEDCDDRTYGTADEDHDEHVAASCANAAALQPLAPQSGLGEGPKFTSALEMYQGDDCNDANKLTFADAVEICDSEDNDCDGIIDEVFGTPAERPATYYEDSDHDLAGNSARPLESLCLSPPPGYANDGGDCDDTDPSVRPLISEICNGKDDDCDGTTDLPDEEGGLLFKEPWDGVTEFECRGAGGWAVSRCPPDRLDCGDRDYLDGCETIGNTMCNCHSCGATCNFSCGETACEEISEISAGSLHTCAIARPVGDATNAGTAACWGWNGHGQLGNGTLQDSSVPMRVENLPRATSLASGDHHVCAVADSKVYCWGYNRFGQLGIEVSVPSSTSPSLARAPYDGAQARRVASGSSHTCAIYDDGVLDCWGLGDQGQLGDAQEGEGHYVTRPVEVRRRVGDTFVPVLNARKVAAGYSHSCALLLDGKVECWGTNSFGQLGRDPTAVISSPVPVPVPALETFVVDDIAAAGDLTCVRADGTILCWGSNWDYELARDDVEPGAVVAIPLPSAAASLAVGTFFGCAVVAQGSLYCWGSNYDGERGTEEDPPPMLPSIVPFDRAVGVFAGHGNHACAKTNSEASCWGRNDRGQLGGGDLTQEPHPAASRVQALGGLRHCN